MVLTPSLCLVCHSPFLTLVDHPMRDVCTGCLEKGVELLRRVQEHYRVCFPQLQFAMDGAETLYEMLFALDRSTCAGAAGKGFTSDK